MAKLEELQKYLDYEFSTGVYTGEDYKKFQNKYINYLRSICKECGWEVVNVGRGHYYFSLFIREGNKHIFLCISDVRYWHNGWYNNILVRTAKHEKDYTGGQNMYTSLERLPTTLTWIFKERCR